MLAWPHDYDQFDHAARIVHHGLGRRCRPQGTRIASDVQALIADVRMKEKVQRFSCFVRDADAKRRIEVMLEELTGQAHEEGLLATITTREGQ
jgi:UDP:flavonoid glycosyltransferase YjiC (YdhE family)